MKTFIKKITVLFMSAAVLGTLGLTAPAASADTTVSGTDDDMEVKTYLNEIAYSPENKLAEDDGRFRISGWDLNQLGGEVISDSGDSLALKLSDWSDSLPVEAKRDFEKVTYGELELYFDLKISSGMKDACVALRQGTTSGIYYGFDGTNIWVQTPEGKKTLISQYKTNVLYLFYTKIHMSTKTFDVYIDNVCYAEGISFDTDSFDNFFYSTGNESVGSLSLKRDVFSLKRGYWIDETFGRAEDNNVPVGWSFQFSNGAYTGAKYHTAKQGFQIGGSKNGSVLSRRFGTQTRDFTAEFYMRVPEGSTSSYVSIMGGGNTVFKFSADGNSFYYLNAKGIPVKCYNSYKKDLWYVVWADIRLGEGTFDLYIDDKEVASNVKLPATAKSVDTFKAVGEETSPFHITGIQIYPTEKFDDYVPEPQIASSDGVDVGMQYFGLWNEGTHFGWDWVNDSEIRRPLDGFYDEDSVEHWDWQIKYWLEHGIDYVAPCWYALGQWTEGVSERVRHPFFKAKYSDKMKFALLMETSGWAGWKTDSAGAEQWLKDVGRQMIEYYFKDSRYYTNGGRPVVFMFGWEAFNNAFPSGNYVLTRLGDMCEEEGLKRPLFILHFGEGFSQWTDSVSSGKSFGGDAFWHYSMNDWSQHAVNANLENISIANSNGYGYVPTVSMGFDDYAWNREVGYRRSPDRVKWELQQYKNEILPRLQGLGNIQTPMINLATWNEWGEGHYFGPCEGMGFSLIDAVREVLTNGGAHNDVTPNEHQKDRFNNLYPWWRKTRVRERNVGAAPAQGTYEKYTWNFDNANALGWNASVGSSLQNGVWKLTADGGRLMLNLTDSGIDTANVTHVKIRMKNKGGANTVYTDVKTDFWNTEAGKRTMHTELTWLYMNDGDDFTDVYIPVGEYPEFWKGILKDMTIAFEGYKNGESLEIDSIAFIAEHPKGNINVVLDGWTCSTNMKLSNNLPMLAVREVSELWKGQVWWDAQNGTVWLKSKNIITKFVPGSDTVECNGKVYTLPNSSMLEDGTTWVNPEILALTFNKTVVWEAETSTLSFTDIESGLDYVRPNSERKLLWGFEFDKVVWEDGNEGWDYSSGMDISSSGGVANFSTSNTDPQFAIKVPSVNLSEARYICIGVRSKSAFRMQMFFQTSTSGISEANSYKTNVKVSDDIYEVVIDVKDIPNFSGTLTKLRLDPGEASGISGGFDYVRIYGDYENELTDDEIAERFSSCSLTEEGMVWNFNLNTNRDGWRLSRSLANAEIQGGVMTVDAICKFPFIQTAQNNLGVDTSAYGTVAFGLKNMIDATEAKVYFTTVQDPAWTEDKCVKVSITPNCGTALVYHADLSTNSAWNGTLRALRIAVTDPQTKVNKGQIGFDYIKLLRR